MKVGPAVEETAVAFVLRLGRALHAAGYSAQSLEDTLVQVSARLGLLAQFFTTPTSIFASFGPQASQQTHLIRVDPGEVNLGKLAALHDVTRGVLQGGMSAEEGTQQVDAIVLAPPAFRRVARTLAYGLASAAACGVLGGGAREMIVAGIAGLITGLLAITVRAHPGLDRLFEVMAAFVASALATAVGVAAGGISTPLVTMAGLIVLLPGLTLTTAMSELASRHLVSGTARLAGAFSVLIGMTFGVALGRQAAVMLLGHPARYDPGVLPAWSLWVGVIALPLAFTVLLRGRPKDLPWIVAASLVGYAAWLAGRRAFGPELGAFVGALVVGIASNLFERVLDRPAAITLVPGVLLLVPGSLGFRSLSSLSDRDILTGVDMAFTMLLTAISLVAGLLLSNILAPTKHRSLYGY